MRKTDDRSSRDHLDFLTSTDTIETDNEIEVSFTNNSENYCVTVVDIVGSTSIVSAISSSEKTRKFYSIFINAMANILRKYDARVIKTVGDGIISFFPKTKDTTNTSAFKDALECCFSQIAESPNINKMLQEEKLPSIGYRISADYGRVEIAKSANLDIDDLFGSTVNFCSKINLRASWNGIVIGSDLYRIIRSIPQLQKSCRFEELAGYYSGVGKYSYPIYSLSKRSQPVNVCNSSTQQEVNEVKKYVLEKHRKASKVPNILLIDDELDDLFVLEKFLTREGFGVKSFSNSREALEHFSRTNPSFYDLIISDIRMPEINGLELYMSLKAIKNDVKILFASAIELAEEILSVMPGVRREQLIRKPVEQEVFIDLVKKAIREPS
jgi:two-component system, OmpR family, response regulator ChvI